MDSQAKPDTSVTARKSPIYPAFPCAPPRSRWAFTLIELVIVILLLGTIAMIVMPKFLDASQDAKESSLLSDLRTVRSQIEVYRNEHNGRGPHLNERGELDPEQFIDRLTGRTFPSGQMTKYGPCGPYLTEWPDNPFSPRGIRGTVKFGWALRPPRDGTTGWYYNIDSCLVSPNSPQGGFSICPADDGQAPQPDKALVAQDGEKGFKLTGILEGPDGRVAMINGQRLCEGQTINNAKVLEIGPYHVQLEVDGKVITLGMNKPVSQDTDGDAVSTDSHSPHTDESTPCAPSEQTTPSEQ